MRRLFLLVLLPLVACGTPQEQCIRGVTKDLRTLDRLIATSQGNLERGYAIESQPYWEREYQVCGWYDRNGKSYANYCWVDVMSTRNVSVAINLDQEAAKLKTMQSKRAELAKNAQPAIAQCQALHPE